MNTQKSVLTYNQKRTLTKKILVDGKKGRIEVDVRYDDSCKNGHNTFSITGTIYTSENSSLDRYIDTCGCIHDEIEKHFPELVHLIKWHLVSSDEPLYYIANTVYHAENGNLESARSTAIWGNATLKQLKDKTQLLARLPKLMLDFKRDIEKIGFTF